MVDVTGANGTLISDGLSHTSDLSMTAMYTHFYSYEQSEQFRIGSVPFATEHFEVRGGIAGAGPVLYASSDTSTDVNLTVTCQGNGGMTFNNWFGPMFTITPAPGEVPYNYVQFLGRNSGNPASIFFSGNDTNVNGYLSAQGTGLIYIANSANGLFSTPMFQFANIVGAPSDQCRFTPQVASQSQNHQLTSLVAGDISIGGPGTVGSGVLATNQTHGFLRIPRMAGQPTGTPAIADTFSPIVHDTTNHKLWLYDGSAWKGVVLS